MLIIFIYKHLYLLHRNNCALECTTTPWQVFDAHTPSSFYVFRSAGARALPLLSTIAYALSHSTSSLYLPPAARRELSLCLSLTGRKPMGEACLRQSRDKPFEPQRRQLRQYDSTTVPPYVYI